MLAAGLGMGVPVLVTGLAGRPSLGLAASLGGLLVGNIRTGRCIGEQLRELAGVLAAAGVAAGSAVLIAGYGLWTYAAMVILAGTAAVIGGYSRFIAVGTARFTAVLVITLTVAEAVRDRVGLLVLIAAGAFWTSTLALAFGSLIRAWEGSAGPAQEEGRTATAAQKLFRWRKSLRQFAGWQYALRLLPCLAVSALFRAWTPHHHFGWIALTVAILSRRQIEPWPVKVTQRAIGATLGVALTGLLVPYTLPAWLSGALIAALASLGPWLQMQNHAAYTAIRTPLIIMLLSAGRPIEISVLVDRLVATVIGAGLVIAASLLASRIEQGRRSS